MYEYSPSVQPTVTCCPSKEVFNSFWILVFVVDSFGGEKCLIDVSHNYWAAQFRDHLERFGRLWTVCNGIAKADDPIRVLLLNRLSTVRSATALP